MHTTLMVADIAVVVHQKHIQNLHLKVLPPDGAVRVSAPYHFSLDAIRLLLVGKIDWIRAQQQKFVDQPRRLPRQYIIQTRHPSKIDRFKFDEDNLLLKSFDGCFKFTDLVYTSKKTWTPILIHYRLDGTTHIKHKSWHG